MPLVEAFFLEKLMRDISICNGLSGFLDEIQATVEYGAPMPLNITSEIPPLTDAAADDDTNVKPRTAADSAKNNPVLKAAFAQKRKMRAEAEKTKAAAVNDGTTDTTTVPKPVPKNKTVKKPSSINANTVKEAQNLPKDEKASINADNNPIDPLLRSMADTNIGNTTTTNTNNGTGNLKRKALDDTEDLHRPPRKSKQNRVDSDGARQQIKGDEKSSNTDGNERRLKCPFCRSRLKTRRDMRRHLYVVERNRPGTSKWQIWHAGDKQWRDDPQQVPTPPYAPMIRQTREE